MTRIKDLDVVYYGIIRWGKKGAFIIRSRSIVVFIVSSVLSVLFISWNWIQKHILMSDIPFQFSMSEGLSFNISILFTVLMLIIVLFFSDRFLKVVTGIYGFFTIFCLVIFMKRWLTYEDYTIWKYLDLVFILMYAIPTIVGLLLIYKIKLNTPMKWNH